jgi:hypothetical protein
VVERIAKPLQVPHAAFNFPPASRKFFSLFFFLVDICEASGYGQSKDFSNFQAFDPLVVLP